MTICKSVFTVQLSSKVLFVHTRLLHAYKAIGALFSPAVMKRLPAYRSIARHLSPVGSVYSMSTPLGILTIEHHPLKNRWIENESGEA